MIRLASDVIWAIWFAAKFALTDIRYRDVAPEIARGMEKMSNLQWRSESRGIEVAEATTAAEFLATLRLSADHWWEQGRNPWAFRGHSSAEWSLSPTAWRAVNPHPLIAACRKEAERRFDAQSPNQKLHWQDPGDPHFLPGVAEIEPANAHLQRQLAIDATAELLAIWDFASACNKLGLPIPLVGPPPDPAVDPDYLWKPEVPLIADEIMVFGSLLGLAQHHKLPTRLLDWSYDPVAAAFFAVEDLKPVSGKPDKIVVWGLHRQRAAQISTVGLEFPSHKFGSPRRDPFVEVYRPLNSDNQYLNAQSGLFTTLRRSGIYYMQHNGKRPTLEELVNASATTDVVLRKLMLDHVHVSDLKLLLNREGMSRSGLMPTLDNIAADVVKAWTAK